MSRRTCLLPVMACMAVTLSGCGGDTGTNGNAERADPAGAAFPASLAAFGDGYPAAGDPCRRLGESDATREWLDDSADLVGCPTAVAATALGGRTLSTVEGITIVSVPRAGNGTTPPSTDTDATVAGTDFNATAQLLCSADGSTPTARCDAGVRRRVGDDGTTFVEITRQDGRPRVIFFRGTEAFSASSAEADGSSDYDFSARRNGDETSISFGPERYIIPDAFVEGG